MISTQEEPYAGSSCCAYGCFGSCCRCPSVAQRERWCVSVLSKIPSPASIRMAVFAMAMSSCRRSLYTGLGFEYVNCNWMNCFEKLENGEIDIMGDISYTDERAEMPALMAPWGRRSTSCMQICKHRGSVLLSCLPSMDGMSVRFWDRNDMLMAWEKKHGIETTYLNTGILMSDLESQVSMRSTVCPEQPFWKR